MPGKKRKPKNYNSVIAWGIFTKTPLEELRARLDLARSQNAPTMAIYTNDLTGEWAETSDIPDLDLRWFMIEMTALLDMEMGNDTER